MNRILATVAALFLTGTANAGIPFFNATCPGGIEVHADQGGPVYVNGKEAKLKKFNDNAYDAVGGGVTINIAVSPDGSPNVAYTGKHGANGICQVKE
jgi:hypothetical protein